LKNLMRELIDARTGFAGAGVTGDEPAPTKLVALPDQAAELRDGFVLFVWGQQKPDGHNG
jgi:hypothetical protein